MNVEPAGDSSKAVLTFYKAEDGRRRARIIISGEEVADLDHDGSMHIELDKRLAARGLKRGSGFHISSGGLVAEIRSIERNR